MKRKKRGSYKFTGKKHSRLGMAALGIAVCSIALGIGVTAVSFRNAGAASVYVGSAGLFSMLLSVIALVLGIKSLREEETYKIFPGIGTFLSAVSFLGWAAVYALGFYMI